MVNSIIICVGIKYSVNEKFFDTWTDGMAYVLGFLFADGSLEDAPYIRGKYMRVTNTDRDRIELIKKLMRSSHTIVVTKTIGNRKPRHLLRIGSHALYNQLMRLGVTPRKSFTMLFPTVPKKFLPHFVRGYFDGDGCAHIARTATGITRLLTIFTSGSKSFLETLHGHLKSEAGVTGNTLHGHGSTDGAFQLRYFARDSIRLFVYMYPKQIPKELLLRRKYDIFTRYFNEVKRSSRRRMSKYIPKGLMVKG